MIMGNPELVRAIVSAAVAQSPQWVRQALASKVEPKRNRAEDALVARIVIALEQLR